MTLDKSSAPPPRILILDDDHQVLESLGRLLRPHFKLTLAQNLEAAHQLIKDQAFDLALLDLHLGQELSLGFFKELQLSSPATVRILLTGELRLDSVIDSLQRSLIHRVIQKPWDPATLRVQLNESMQLHQLLKEKLRLEHLSTTDELTGLGNFRALRETLPKEIERSKRTARPLSFLMLDIDGLKALNDSRGHLKGDEVLREIGQLIKASLRSFDTVCRYGGDEFAVLLQETDLERAAEIADRIRTSVQTHSPLTISVGVASFDQTSLDEDQLLAHADRALYSAKNAGRNRVGIAAHRHTR